jgi:hypothetical protein
MTGMGQLRKPNGCGLKVRFLALNRPLSVKIRAPVQHRKRALARLTLGPFMRR